MGKRGYESGREECGGIMGWSGGWMSGKRGRKGGVDELEAWEEGGGGGCTGEEGYVVEVSDIGHQACLGLCLQLPLCP